MNVVILCDSKFGNTRRLAESMSAALHPDHHVELRGADDGLGRMTGIDVLLVGGPTHAHGASTALKHALAAIPADALKGARVAAFDTRFRMPRVLTGSAAADTSKLLRRSGYDVIAPAESFFVTREDPPALVPGEIDRARSWARAIVS